MAEKKKKGGLPVLWRIPAAWRLIRSPDEQVWKKVLLVMSAAYVVFPLDAVPDVALLVGWLDDAGVVAATAALLHRSLDRHRSGTPQPK